MLNYISYNTNNETFSTWFSSVRGNSKLIKKECKSIYDKTGVVIHRELCKGFKFYHVNRNCISKKTRSS